VSRWHAALALLLAFAVKAFYARADADALGFVLAPTAALVGALSGRPFEAEPGIGYLSRGGLFVIAPACAGLNWFVIAFLTLALGFGGRLARPGPRLAWLAAAAALAFAATVLVNALRIALALALRDVALPPWLDAEALHRLEGVLVYLASLGGLCLAVDRGWPGRSAAGGAAALGLAVYLAVTLAVPLANGAAARPGFWTHAAAVLVLSLGVAALATVASRWISSCRKSRAS
jgi:exosortase K